jgi:acrylyl-CoA reductase (NADPH)
MSVIPARSSRASTLAGELIGSEDPAVPVGTAIVAHGYDLGVARLGGLGAFTRLPAGYVVPLAAMLTARDSMAIGTAGFTASMSVAALESMVRPGDGPVLVTGDRRQGRRRQHGRRDPRRSRP